MRAALDTDWSAQDLLAELAAVSATAGPAVTGISDHRRGTPARTSLGAWHALTRLREAGLSLLAQLNRHLDDAELELLSDAVDHHTTCSSPTAT